MELPSYARPAPELIRERYSCRKFIPSPIPESKLEELRQFSLSLEAPKGAPPRFEFFASKQGDAAELKGLGTYGMIQNPAAFVAVVKGPGTDILGLGWTTELLVLKATELGIGSCWLGGTFRHGRFSKAAGLGPGERLAIVIALGLEAEGARDGALRRRVRGSTRKAWPEIFFDGAFERPIAGPADLARLSLDPVWAEALEGLRLSPSASNKQPWALVKTQEGWELHLRRDKGYYPRLARWLGMVDMQANDMGIAMVHLALEARERSLPGEWAIGGAQLDVDCLQPQKVAQFDYSGKA
jgi:nitroreductase